MKIIDYSLSIGRKLTPKEEKTVAEAVATLKEIAKQKQFKIKLVKSRA